MSKFETLRANGNIVVEPLGKNSIRIRHKRWSTETGEPLTDKIEDVDRRRVQSVINNLTAQITELKEELDNWRDKLKLILVDK